THPTGDRQGKNTAGSLGGTVGNDQILGVHLVAGAAGTNYNFGELSGASISGFVYMDSNDNGARDSGEPPILGVAITLSGTNDLGNTVSLTQQTGRDGSYALHGLRQGTFTVSETKPAG